MEQTFALHIIRDRAEHALVAKHGDSVLRHLHGAPLMAGIALQIPRLLLVGDHKRVGFGAAVGFHDLAVVFNRFARRGGNRRNIAADPRLGRAVLHIWIRRFHCVADVGRHRAGHGHAHLVGHGAIPQALDERRRGVLVGHIRQRHFFRADGHGAPRFFAVRIDDLLRLRGVPRIDGVADNGMAAGAGLLADIVAGAGECAGAGEGHGGCHRETGRAFEELVHSQFLRMTICHLPFRLNVQFAQSVSKDLRLLYSRFRRFSSAFFAAIHERNDYLPSSSGNLFTLSDNLSTLQLSFCKYRRGLSPPSPPPKSEKHSSSAHAGDFAQFAYTQKRPPSQREVAAEGRRKE